MWSWVIARPRGSRRTLGPLTPAAGEPGTSCSVDQVGVERAYRREFPSDGGRGVPGSAVRRRSPVGADQLGQPVTVAVDVRPGGPERMKAASGAPAQEDRQIAGVRFPGPRSKLGLQEVVDKVGNLLIRGDDDRIGGHTIQIGRHRWMPLALGPHLVDGVRHAGSAFSSTVSDADQLRWRLLLRARTCSAADITRALLRLPPRRSVSSWLYEARA